VVKITYDITVIR